MSDWDEKQIMDFTAEKSGEQSERAVEGPAVLGSSTVWRSWTFDGNEYHAHYVIAEEGVENLVSSATSSPLQIG